MDVGGGELAEDFAGGEEVGGAGIGAAGDEDVTGGDVPLAIALDEHEAVVGGDGGDAADEGGGAGSLGNG